MKKRTVTLAAAIALASASAYASPIGHSGGYHSNYHKSAARSPMSSPYWWPEVLDLWNGVREPLATEAFWLALTTTGWLI